MSVLDSVMSFSGNREKALFQAYMKISSMSGCTLKEETLQIIRAEMKSSNSNISLVIEKIREYRDMNYLPQDNGYQMLETITRNLKN